MKTNPKLKKSLSKQFVSLMSVFLIIFFLVAAGVSVSWQMLLSSYSDENKQLKTKEQLAQEIDETFNLAFFDARGYLAYDNPELKDKALGKEKKIRKMEKRLEKLVTTDRDRIFLNNAYQFTNYYFVDTLPVVLAFHEANDRAGVILLGNKKATPRVNHFQDELKNYSEELDRDVQKNVEKLKTLQSYIQISFIVFVLMILISLLLIIRIMLRRIGEPLSQFAAAANDIAQGRDSSIPLDSVREDEIGVLAAAFKKMVEKIQEKEQDLLAHNEELLAQQDELQAQQTELESALDILKTNESELKNRNKLINSLTNSLDKQDVLNSAIEIMCSLIEADQGVIMMTKGPCFASLGVSEEGIAQFKSFYHNGLNQRLVQTMKPFIIKREIDGSEKGYHIGTHYTYDLYVPIFSSSNEVQAIMVFSRFSSPFLEEDMDQYQAYSKNIGLALDKIQLYENSEAERKLVQDILNSIQAGVQLIDHNRTTIQVNMQISDILGIEEYSDRLIGMSWEEWISILKGFTEDEEGLMDFLENAVDFNRKSSVSDLSFIFKKKDSDRAFKIYSEDLYKEDVKYGTIIVYRDISREFEVDQMKSEFVSTVSHELRTPLASILGFTELILNRELKPEKQKKYLSTIFNEAKRLTSLINDFLDVQRMEAGKQTYEKKYVEMVPILEKVIESQRISSEKHEIILETHFLHPVVLGDKNKLEQVFTNLVNNAIKYSPAGGRVCVKLGQDEEFLKVDVTDEGLGIPEDAIPKLFAKFYRIDNSDRRKIGGTGLGLAIVQEIIKAHGGEIEVFSDYGIGSTFSVRFPIVKALHDKHANPEQMKELGHGYQVMVIEDDLNLSQLIVQELNDSGFSTIHFRNGKEALMFLETEIPDALVLDIMLEEDDLDGWNIMDALKSSQKLKNIPIIVSSALEEKEKGFSLGADEYLIKPYKPSQLSKAIMQTLLKIGKVGQILIPEEKVVTENN